MAAANDLEMVVSHARRLVVAGAARSRPTSPFMANLAWGAIRTSGTMLSWLFSGMFQRYPNLKIALSEGEIGWIPYFLERAEQVLDKQRHWVKQGMTFMDHAATDVDLDTIDIRATVPRPHLRLLHRGRATASRSLDEIGEDNVMCETDYPHSDSTWPDCIGVGQAPHRAPARGDAVQDPARQRRAAVPLHARRAAGARACLTRAHAVDRGRPRAVHGQRHVHRVRARARSRTTTRRRRSWSIPTGDPIDAIRIAVEACPTGALRTRRSTTNEEELNGMLLEGKSAVDHWAPARASGAPRRCASPRRAPRSSSPTSTLDGAKETVPLIEAAGGTAVADRVRRVAGGRRRRHDRRRGRALRAARHHLQQRRHPDAAARA